MPIEFTCTGAGNQHVLTCTTGGRLLVSMMGKLNVSETSSLPPARIGEWAENTQTFYIW